MNAVPATSDPVIEHADETWSSRLTRFIASEIRQRRKARKWSAQGLSDGCADLGLKISRTAIADLENGRRQFITLAEFLSFTQALQAQPADLLPPGNPATWQAIAPPDPLPAIRRKVTELSRLLEPGRATS